MKEKEDGEKEREGKRRKKRRVLTHYSRDSTSKAGCNKLLMQLYILCGSLEVVAVEHFVIN